MLTAMNLDKTIRRVSLILRGAAGALIGFYFTHLGFANNGDVIQRSALPGLGVLVGLAGLCFAVSCILWTVLKNAELAD